MKGENKISQLFSSVTVVDELRLKLSESHAFSWIDSQFSAYFVDNPA